MFSLIPLPYRILSLAGLALALFASGFGAGMGTANNRHAAQQLAAERASTLKYQSEVARGNILSAKLADSEGKITIKTVEVIKYVPQVTTGRECLSADAVSLLNSDGYPSLSATPRKPAAESPAAPAASDADVAYWISAAHRAYDTCAVRLNSLVEWAEKGTE